MIDINNFQGEYYNNFYVADKYIKNKALNDFNKRKVLKKVYNDFLKYQNNNKDINDLIKNDLYNYLDNTLNSIKEISILDKILRAIFNVSTTIFILLILFLILRLLKIPKSINSFKNSIIINNGLLINASVIAIFINIFIEKYFKSKTTKNRIILFLLFIGLLVITNLLTILIFKGINIPYGNISINYISFFILFMTIVMILLISNAIFKRK